MSESPQTGKSPHSFADRSGTKWTVEVTTASLKRCKTALNLNLATEALGGELFAKLASDPILLADVLFVLCEEQAKERGVDDVQFGRQLAGDCIAEATEALVEALIDFFPKRRREVLGKILTSTKKMETAALDATEKWLDSGKLETEVEERLRQISSQSVTSTPES